jgi:hypothetical protein
LDQSTATPACRILFSSHFAVTPWAAPSNEPTTAAQWQLSPPTMALAVMPASKSSRQPLGDGQVVLRPSLAAVSENERAFDQTEWRESEVTFSKLFADEPFDPHAMRGLVC